MELMWMEEYLIISDGTYGVPTEIKSTLLSLMVPMWMEEYRVYKDGTYGD